MIPRAKRRLEWLGTTTYNLVRSWCPERVKLNDDEDDHDSKLLSTNDLELNRRDHGIDEKDDSDFESGVSRDWADKQQLLADLQSLIIILQQKQTHEWRIRNWPMIISFLGTVVTLIASGYGLNREIGKLDGIFNQYHDTIAFNSTLPCPDAYPQFPAYQDMIGDNCYTQDQWQSDESFVENCKNILIAYCKHLTGGYLAFDTVAIIAFMCSVLAAPTIFVYWLFRDDKEPMLRDLPQEARDKIVAVNRKITDLDPADYLGVKPTDTVANALEQFKDQAKSMQREARRIGLFAHQRRIEIRTRAERVQPAATDNYAPF